MDRLADILVRYSTQVQPGHPVRLAAPPVAQPLVELISRDGRFLHSQWPQP